MTPPPFRSGIAAAIVMAAAAGCALSPANENAAAPVPASPQPPVNMSKMSAGTHPIAAFLAAARAGDSTFLTIPESGSRVQVTADRVYFAASGRYCRKYLVTSTNSATTMSPGLACRNAQGDWQLENLIVNPGNVISPLPVPATQ